MNPFVEEPQKAGIFSKYPTDDNYHVVWVKGKKAKVPGRGSFRCPTWEFDKVAFVCMHERTLPINLSTHQFFSSDKLAVQVQVDLIAQIQTTEWALIAAATCFDESFEILQTDVISIVREFCRARTTSAILESEKELAAEIVKRTETTASSKTFLIKDASTHFRIPFLEKAAEHDADSTIAFEQNVTKEKRETSLTKLRNTRTLTELVGEMEREKRKVESECAARTAKAHTEIEIEAARLANLQAYAKLTDESKTAVLHLHPEIYRELKLAEITNDPIQRGKALQEIMGLLKPLAEITKSAAPITGVI